jgi:transcriptional regulator with GAF, ATPase, and Fis domain
LAAALARNRDLSGRIERENAARDQAADASRRRIIGKSEVLLEAVLMAESVAAADTPVLLLGETGTGKELLAQAIHALSRRRGRPMVAVNCSSLPATLVEGELFGREAGAYTGAVSRQMGRFEAADGSTLFLDEIGDMPVELQSKLLRVLEDGRFERLGSAKTIRANVRVVAATNRDLRRAVREGRFRGDLFHRLNVFPVRVPPLRERTDDIPLLVWTFAEEFGRRMGKTITTIPRRDMARLQQYPWPGNVRELRNVVERAMILAAGDTLHIELPPAAPAVSGWRMTLDEVERMHIRRVLDETAWRIRGPNGAAEVLGVKPTTLEARMAKLGIRREK